MPDDTTRAIQTLVERLESLTSLVQADLQDRREQRKSFESQNREHNERMKFNDRENKQRLDETHKRMEESRQETKVWQQHQRETWDQLLVELKRHNDLLEKLLQNRS
jgi:hypothetical protein